MYKTNVTVLPEDTPHVCGRIGCAAVATFLSQEIAQDGGPGPQVAYCDRHWSEYANNDLLEILSLEDPHKRLAR